ncbi:hypothetical protein Pmani_027564 [Petrolisthes manimaculis]|uniref:Centromere protein I n=1 Tax=Petrolisthes manimaculis TaxID=1843537 RepID=A0AAE1P149_9EUCA|nr:hypothetical protein Pmani_027564 [Petrolisthes manimaculis]
MLDQVDNALKFFVESGKKRPRDIPQQQLQDSVKVLETASLHGLTHSQLDTLAFKVVFTDAFNTQIRRRLLYCLVAEGKKYPQHLIPYAISDANVVPTNVVWQRAVLIWLLGMLEYGIFSSGDSGIRICYTSIFNQIGHFHLSSLACKILTLVTTPEDVTPFRANTLMRLKHKVGFYVPVSQLLRLYKLFRPDIVGGNLSDQRVTTSCPKYFREALLAARHRLQEELGVMLGLDGSGEIWRDGTSVDRINLYQRKTAIPQPHIHKFAITMEEKQRKVIYVSQYRKFGEMVKGIEEHQNWEWPSNPASHLAYPLILTLFRSHQPHVLINLTNWLEIALRTEVTNNMGNPGKERRSRLLDATLELCRVTATPLPFPVINHFIHEFISTGWDLHQDSNKVLRLLEYVGFTSPEFLTETLLKVVSQLTCKVSLTSWCHVVNAITTTATSWCLMEYHDTTSDNMVVRPQELYHVKYGVGLWYLTRHLEKIFKAAVLTYQAHPLCLHSILDYYVKVNGYCEELGLSLAYFPPVLITLTILTHTDLAATHRLGLLMVSMRKASVRLQAEILADDIEEQLRLEALESLEGVNSALRLFFSALYKGKFLTAAWEKDLSQFYSFHFLDDIRRRSNANKALSITNALSYFPYYGTLMLDETDEEIQLADKQENVLAQLREAGLTGIENCILEYKK